MTWSPGNSTHIHIYAHIHTSYTVQVFLRGDKLIPSINPQQKNDVHKQEPGESGGLDQEAAAVYSVECRVQCNAICTSSELVDQRKTRTYGIGIGHVQFFHSRTFLSDKKIHRYGRLMGGTTCEFNLSCHCKAFTRVCNISMYAHCHCHCRPR